MLQILLLGQLGQRIILSNIDCLTTCTTQVRFVANAVVADRCSRSHHIPSCNTINVREKHEEYIVTDDVCFRDTVRLLRFIRTHGR